MFSFVILHATQRISKKTKDVELSGDDVLISPGSKEAIFLLQLCYDAELMLPSPSWVSYAPQVG